VAPVGTDDDASVILYTSIYSLPASPPLFVSTFLNILSARATYATTALSVSCVSSQV
jgi:hypothetical protein